MLHFFQRKDWDIHRGECLFIKLLSPRIPFSFMRLYVRCLILMRQSAEFAELVAGLCSSTCARSVPTWL